MILRELIVKLGLVVQDKDFLKAEGAIGKVKKAAVGLAAALGGGALAYGLARLVNTVTTTGDDIAKAAQRIGISAEALQELHFAGDLANVSAEQLNNGLKFLARNASEAARGTGEAKDTFGLLGIAVRDANGRLRPTEDLLGDVADGLSRLPTQGQRVDASMRLMGRSGADLLTMLQSGRGTIEAARAEFRALGGGFTEAEARRMEEYRDNLTRMDRVFTRIKISIVTALLPAFEFVVGGMIKAGKAINGFLKGTKFLEAAFITLGAVAVALGVKFLIAFAVPIAIVLGLGVALFGVALAVEEFFALFDDEVDSLGKRWAGWVDEFAHSAEAGESAWLTAIRAIVYTITDIQGAVETAVDFYIAQFTRFFTWVGAKWGQFGVAAASALKAVPGLGHFLANAAMESAAAGAAMSAPLETRTIAPSSKAINNAPTFNMELEVHGTDAQTATEIADNLVERIDERLQSHLDNAFYATVR